MFLLTVTDFLNVLKMGLFLKNGLKDASLKINPIQLATSNAQT